MANATALGIVVRKVGGLKGALLGTGYAVAAIVTAAGFTAFCAEAHDRSIADMRDAAERIARMEKGSGRFVHEAKAVARNSVVRYFALRDSGADEPDPDASKETSSDPEAYEAVQEETRKLRALVAVMRGPSDDRDRLAIRDKVDGASLRVRAAGLLAKEGSAEARKLRALQIALNAMVTGLSNDVSARGVVEEPVVEAALNDDGSTEPAGPRL